jgi:hypothetical protein
MTTTFTGAGLSQFGTSYAGYGTPTTTNPVNKTILIGNYGIAGQTRFINPITGDYEFNANGRIIGGNGIQQLVYLALVTVRGSSAMLTLGQSFTNIQVIGSNYITFVKGEVNKALKDLIDQKKIELVDVTVDTSNTTSRIRIKWRDLATGTELTNTI